MANNINIQQKQIGDFRTAAEDNIITNWGNAPGQSLGAWTPEITILDGSGTYDSYTATGNITISFSGTPELNNWQKVRITGLNGSYTITTPSDSAILNSSFTDGVAPDSGTYDLWMVYIDGEYQFNLASVSIKGGDITAPTMTSRTIENANPTDIVMVFDEVVSGTNLGFTINGTTSTTFASLSGSGTNTLTGVLAVAAAFGETVTLDYSSVTGDIVDQNLNALATISGAAVTNNVADVSAPTVSTMTVEDAAPNDLIVTFSSSCTFTNVGYTFRVDSTPRTLSAVSGSPGTVATFTISGAAILSTDTLDLAYDSGAGDTIKQSNSVELVTFTATTVTNNIAGAAYGTLSNIELILDDIGLQTNQDNSYGNVDGSGNVLSWKSITPGPTGRDFAIEGTSVVLDGNGVQFAGLGALINTVKATWKFFHYNAASIKWTAHAVVTIQTIPDPQTIEGIFANTGGGIQSTVGVQAAYDDRPSLNNASVFHIARNGINSNDYVTAIQDDNVYTPNQLQVLTYEVDMSLGVTGAQILKNKVNIATSNHNAGGVNLDSTYDLAIGGIGNSAHYFDGTIRTIVFQSGVETSTVRNTFIDSLMSKYSIT